MEGIERKPIRSYHALQVRLEELFIAKVSKELRQLCDGLVVLEVNPEWLQELLAQLTLYRVAYIARVRLRVDQRLAASLARRAQAHVQAVCVAIEHATRGAVQRERRVRCAQELHCTRAVACASGVQ